MMIDLSRVVKRLNNRDHGSAASVWSGGAAAARSITDRIGAGTVWVDGTHVFLPSIAIAGRKQSSTDVENAIDGLSGYTNSQTLVTNPVGWQKEAFEIMCNPQKSLNQRSSQKLSRGDQVSIRHADIFEKATRLFLDHGYQGVSINMIVAALGGSKRDLYRIIGDKDTLFRETITELCRRRADAMAEITLSDDPAVDLEALGTQFLTMLLEPDSLRLHRLVVAEGRDFPAITAEFYRYGPSSTYAAASAVLEHHRAAGRMQFDDSGVAARLFLDSLTGDLQLRALSGLTIEQQEVKARLKAAVAAALPGLSSDLQDWTRVQDAKAATSENSARCPGERAP